MTAPNVIWAWPWEVNPNMGQWEAKPSIVGEGIRYIRADAPELLALVTAVKGLAVLDIDDNEAIVRVYDLRRLRAAIVSYEVMASTS